jgi:hypothetical protein
VIASLEAHHHFRLKDDELQHVGVLAITTIGFPGQDIFHKNQLRILRFWTKNVPVLEGRQKILCHI